MMPSSQTSGRGKNKDGRCIHHGRITSYEAKASQGNLPNAALGFFLMRGKGGFLQVDFQGARTGNLVTEELAV